MAGLWAIISRFSGSKALIRSVVLLLSVSYVAAFGYFVTHRLNFVEARRLLELESLELPARVMLGEESDRYRLLEGFGHAEGWGRWTIGEHGRIGFRLAAVPASDLLVCLDVRTVHIAEEHPELLLEVRVGGEKTVAERFEWPDSDPRRVELRVPSEAVDESGRLVLELRVDRAVSPQSLGKSPDERKLGIGIDAIELLAP